MAKKLNKLKALSILLLSNFLSFNMLAQDLIKVFDADDMNVRANSSGKLSLFENNSNRYHEIKLEGGGDPVWIFPYRRYDTKTFWFETNGNGSSKDRSEVRMRGADLDYGEIYYTSFKIFYPSWATKVPANDWSIIWQCPQIGASVPYYDYNTSPPLNIQLRDDKLLLRSVQNYKMPKSTSRQYITSEDYISSLPRNRWVSVLMRFKMGENGHYKVWYNGKVVLDRRIPIGYKGAFNPYHPGLKKENCSIRFGIYKKGRGNDRMGILFDEVKVGHTYESAKPTR